MKRILALLAVLLLLSGCAADAGTDLMASITENPTALNQVAETDPSAAMYAFALTLFRTDALNTENTLISPLSILSALAMTANGADGETLAQMESLFGVPIETLNTFFGERKNEKNGTLQMANGIWFRDNDLTVFPAFLQANADYYGAAAKQAAMDDATRRAINRWIEQNTDGMIRNMLDRLEPDTAMCLVNALAFEAEWSDPYEKGQVRNGEFTAADGTTTNVEFMHSTESAYLELDGAVGFIKYYKGRRYGFVAILPEEGVTPGEYAASLTADALTDLDVQNCAVITSMPKFSYEYTIDLEEPLQNAGMLDAFSAETADFSRMGESSRGNLYIDRVLHKTFITVAEQGTRAGAATVVMMDDRAAAVTEEPKYVELDRPFLYLIVDLEENFPIFIGAVNHLS